jgi:lipid-binding SYLF domain-containing protein
MTEMMMTRRGLLLGAGALGLTACNNGVGSNGGAQIDARVDATQSFLFSRYPGTQDLANRANGVLYMPLMTEAGFGIGGAFGRGALRIGGATVDYYSAAKGTIGFQIGAQQYAHALFFMTSEALEEFRRSSGWAASGEIRYATPEQGASIGKETTELDPVIALVFGQQGLIAGATLGGVKYTRIIP